MDSMCLFRPEKGAMIDAKDQGVHNDSLVVISRGESHSTRVGGDKFSYGVIRDWLPSRCTRCPNVGFVYGMKG